MNLYKYNRSSNVGKIGINKIENYLLSLPNTIDIINVEDDSSFQQYDIDIILVNINNIINIEVKTDTYKSGNFFFETTSNKGKNTKGCFMYTKTDFIYYYYIKSKELYILPMPETREWFLKNINRFEKKNLGTSVRDGYYGSSGYIVPIKEVVENMNIEKKVLP